jgi:hypothetical protein
MELAAVILILAAVAPRAAEQAPDLETLRRATALCDALLAGPSDPERLEAFRAGAAGISETGAVRRLLAAVYSLGLLAGGEAKTARAVRDAIMQGELDTETAEMLDEKMMTVECPTCSGAKTAECPACRGNPVCPRCGGKGWIQAPTEGVNTRPGCPSCRGAGKCATCRGGGRVSCPTCTGRGALLSPDRIRERYLSALAETRKRFFESGHPEMLAMRTEMDRARGCANLDEAIAVLTAALEKYADSGNAGEAREMLAGFERDREDAERAARIKKSLVANAGNGSDGGKEAGRRVPATVNSFLKALSRGGTGAEFWTDRKNARALFVPVSWHIGKAVIVGGFAKVPAQVEADGVGPDAYRDVVFYLENKGEWRITAVEITR